MQKKKKKFKWLKRALIVFVIFIIGGGIFSYFSTQSKKSAKEDKKDLIVKVKRGDLELTINETGRIEASRQVSIRSRVSGIVANVHVEEGDDVKKNQPLFQLETQDYRREVAQSRANMQVAQARLNELQRGYRPEEIRENEVSLERAHLRLNHLRNEQKRTNAIAHLISQKEIAQRLSDVQLAEADVKAAATRLAKMQQGNRIESIQSAQATLARERLMYQKTQAQLGYTSIKSPLDGVVIARGIEAGETVSAGVAATGTSPTLMTIADLSQLIIKTSLNQIDIGKVKLAQKVKVTLNAYPGKEFEGYVSKIAPAAVKSNIGQDVYVFPIEVTIKKSKNHQLLKPGMSTNIDIQIESKKQVLYLPVEAVRIKDSKAKVTLAEQDKKTEKDVKDNEKEIKIGLITSRYIEVLEGLSENQEVEIKPESAKDNTFGI